MNIKSTCMMATFCLGFTAFIAQPQQPQINLPFKTLAQQSRGEHAQKKDYVIRAQADWDKLQKQAFAGQLNSTNMRDDSTLRKIDFSKQMIIAVFQGQKPSGGYSIAITKLSRDDKRLEVFVEEKSPGSGCFTTQVITQPYHLIVTEKSDRKVVFTRRQINVNC